MADAFLPRFANQRVLITGGSSGIGLAAAQQLAREGAQLILVARDEAKLQAAIAGLPGSGHLHRAVDLVKEDEAAAAINELTTQAGRLDGCVCCAGAHAIRPLIVSKAVNFEELYRQNVISAVNTVRPALRAFGPEGGSVVLMSSVAGLRGALAASAYAASKGAVLALARSLALEFASKRIRVNAVVPGVVETPMTERFLGLLPGAQKDALVQSHPLGLGRPADVAAAIAFLVSREARWVTGTELVVDGGLACH